MQSQDESPNPQYDFILNSGEQYQPKPHLPRQFPKPLIFAGALIGLLILIVVIVLALQGSSSNSNLVEVIGEGQEIARVSTLVQSQTNDLDTKNLTATATLSLNSSQQQLTAYSKKNHNKFSDKQLAVYVNKKTDSDLTTAQQNGNLETTYNTYLKNSLNQYALDIKAASGDVGPNGLEILTNAYQSALTLLKAPQLNKS